MQKSTDLRKMFVKFDSNNDGEISEKEFRKVSLWGAQLKPCRSFKLKNMFSHGQAGLKLRGGVY